MPGWKAKKVETIYGRDEWGYEGGEHTLYLWIIGEHK
jgi:hypothetical protein